MSKLDSEYWINRARLMAAGMLLTAATAPVWNTVNTVDASTPTSGPALIDPTLHPNQSEIRTPVSQAERQQWYKLLTEWKLNNGKTFLEQFSNMKNALSDSFELVANTNKDYPTSKFSVFMNSPIEFYRDSTIDYMKIETTIDSSTNVSGAVRVFDSQGNLLGQNYKPKIKVDVILPTTPNNPELDAFQAAYAAYSVARQAILADEYLQIVSKNSWRYEISGKDLGFRAATRSDNYLVAPTVAFGYARDMVLKEGPITFDIYLNSKSFDYMGSLLMANWWYKNREVVGYLKDPETSLFHYDWVRLDELDATRKIDHDSTRTVTLTSPRN